MAVADGDDNTENHTVELNIVSIVIGVLIARIIWLWMGNTGLYVQSLVDIDPDDSIHDREKADDMLPGTLVATSIILLIIMIVIAGYM